VQILQGVAWGAIPRGASLGCFRVAPVSPFVVTGVRAAVRQVAVDVREDISLLVVGKSAVTPITLFSQLLTRRKVHRYYLCQGFN
jgi:hypothetical protein